MVISKSSYNAIGKTRTFVINFLIKIFVIYLRKKYIIDDSLALSNAGVFAIVIECVVESLAKKITRNISVPTIGIGAS